jgi:hypothetical protein
LACSLLKDRSIHLFSCVFFEEVVQKNGVLYLSITLSSLLSPFFSSFGHPVLVSCMYFS